MFTTIRSILVVSLIAGVVHADDASTLAEQRVRYGSHDKRYGARGLHGDLHLTGFQGQPYAVPTQSGSTYALLSMSSLYMNARMQDMTTAEHCVAEAMISSMPPREQRECLSYPGTYMTKVGIVSGDEIVIEAQPRGMPLIVRVNGEAHKSSQLTTAVANATVDLDQTMSTLTFTTSDIRITARNVDRYVSVSVDVLRSEWLDQGRREMIPRNKGSRYANSDAASTLPVSMHGLLGQSINYVIYPGGAVYQGDSNDYIVKSITSNEFRYSLYDPSMNARVSYL